MTAAAQNDPFTNRALQIYEDAKTQLGYSAFRFLGKIRRDGGLVAAKYWLRPSKATEGFERLRSCGRLDLSVEFVALQSPWNKLFTEGELETARLRLRQFGYKGEFDLTSARSYWVVSPNVRNNEDTVDTWRRVSVRFKVAVMGWYPNDYEHGQIGPTFAGNAARSVNPGDVILIARRHHGVPEVVGFGIVKGPSLIRLPGIRTPESFGSLRRLQPFVPWSGSPPANVPLIEAVRHTRALARLDPIDNESHLKICEWLNQQLQITSSAQRGRNTTPPNRHIPESVIPRIVSSPENHQLDFKIQTRAKIIRAKKVEAQLLADYRYWLTRQGRLLHTIKYKTLQCDAYEKERHNLIEAKSSASREHIRMAVGQILDYAFQGGKKFGNPNKAILLPREPAADIIAWLNSLAIKVIWREARAFLDNANGQFS